MIILWFERLVDALRRLQIASATIIELVDGGLSSLYSTALHYKKWHTP